MAFEAASRNPWMELFLSADGRMGRPAFLGAAAALAAATVLFEAVTPEALAVAGWVIYPALVFCGACVLSKRLHDRGRSGWWAALVLTAVVALWPQPQGFWDFLFFGVLVWAAVELGCMPSETGANRFGPPPGRPAEA